MEDIEQQYIIGEGFELHAVGYTLYRVSGKISEIGMEARRASFERAAAGQEPISPSFIPCLSPSMDGIGSQHGGFEYSQVHSSQPGAVGFESLSVPSMERRRSGPNLNVLPMFSEEFLARSVVSAGIRGLERSVSGVRQGSITVLYVLQYCTTEWMRTLVVIDREKT
ncbi:hypothetical protein R1sor_021085 [Riccia sorocarpa]|uniref:Uncharacterized protein n=1 Tax=Riccia sorocarpa TaxID=122646 RepID=A0ABD3GK92_9MARC